MSQPSVGSATPHLDALRAEMNPQQRANFDKMLNHQPKLKRMYNATMKTAVDAWNSQPGLRARAFGNGVADVTSATVSGAGDLGRTVGRGLGTAGRVSYDAVTNPRQTLDNAADLGRAGLNAAGRGLAAGTAATGRGIASVATAAAQGVANSRLGRWAQDIWSRGSAAAEAGRRAFSEGRANPNSPNLSSQDRLDLSDRAAAIVTAQSPEERLAATQELLTQLQSQIEKHNTQFGNAQAPAAQAVQTPAATGPQQGAENAAVNLQKNENKGIGKG